MINSFYKIKSKGQSQQQKFKIFGLVLIQALQFLAKQLKFIQKDKISFLTFIDPHMMISRHLASKFYLNLIPKCLVINRKLTGYNFATLEVPLDSKQKLQLVRKQPWFEDYQSATHFNTQENYIDALRHYNKVIQIMEERNQKGQLYYYKIFQKILKINVQLQRPLQLQENLYKLIKVKKTLQKNPILVYEDYQNLMVHQLNHNLEKAIKLGKALLCQSQINNLPISIQKNIRMLLGNAYLLVDNYADAKRKYGQVLQLKPTAVLRGKTLNNLSVASWWHKNPMFSIQHQISTNYEEIRINRDFKQTKQLLMNSIGALQNIDNMDEKEADALERLLNQNPEQMLALSSKNNKEGSSYLIQQRQSLTPIYNTIQYYIYNDPIQKPLIMAWMRILLKSASKFQASELIDEITSKYYLLNNQVSQLKKLLKNLAPKYEQSISQFKNLSIKQNVDQKLFLLQIYKLMNMIKKVAPSDPPDFNVDEAKIKQLQKELTEKDPYIFKRQFLLSEDLSFMKPPANV